MSTHIEHDSFGDIEVDDAALWGAQTQRSLQHFDISTERLPPEFIRALALVKACCARANVQLGLLPAEVGEAIHASALEVVQGGHAAQFPLRVWQTGSGTQSNMNMNEVLAHLASRRLGGLKVHPNDHVNLGQSSNDIFPTALHVATAQAVHTRLQPALRELRQAFGAKALAFHDLVKVGRTHLQDAVPLTLGQEISAYVSALEQAERHLEAVLPMVHELAVGGTAVGTGLNTHPEFGGRVCAELSVRLDLPLRQAGNLFAALATHDPLVQLHGSLNTLATTLMKIANDVRWLASGPRCGLGELVLPANEPGSSIMPGKVNPTQCEALAMVCAQVMGNHVAMTVAGAGGQLQLNTYKPLIAHNLLQSIRLLGDAMRSFTQHCIEGLQADAARLGELLSRSLMLATALAPHIGYDRTARIAMRDHREGLTLRAASLREGVQADDFDRWVQPAAMLAPSAGSAESGARAGGRAGADAGRA